MARLDRFSREISAIVDEKLSPRAQQIAAARAATNILNAAQKRNAEALGAPLPYTQTVDGRRGAALDSVKIENGLIVFQFEVFRELLRWIGEQLVLNSPVLTGRYRDSHVLLADGVEIEVGGKIPLAETYTFVNVVPYARRIERGLSDQAPDGVYESIAEVARRRFGNFANIRFTYRSLYLPNSRKAERDSRYPAITVSAR